MNVNIKKTLKALSCTLLGLSALGFTSMSAYADGASDAALYCTTCHDGMTVNGTVIGGGEKIPMSPTLGVTGWTSVINRMKGKGCFVPATSISGIATYLASLEPTTQTTTTTSTATTATPTTTTAAPTTTTAAPTTTTAAPTSTTATPTTTTATPTTTTARATSTTVANTTTTTMGSGGGQADVARYCSGCHGVKVNNIIVAGNGDKTCSQRSAAAWTSTIDKMKGKGCGVPVASIPAMANYLASIGGNNTTTTTTNAGGTTTTVAGTTTTTAAGSGCDTHVNGTTQYKYSGSGSCHSHNGHVVRDQKWCRQQMTQFNSKGNHTHSYPHPMCM